MKFFFVTLFPELIHPWLHASILGRAHANGIFSFETVNLRDFAKDKHQRTDDVAYGGGGGMVLKVEPLALAVENILERSPSARTLLFSPRGQKLEADTIERSARQKESEIILICGHYEGIDERFIQGWVDEVFSIGDFVVSGGELAALVFADAVIRHLEGTLPVDTAKNESFSIRKQDQRLLEGPHYTRPREFRGMVVPEVLLAGNHTNVSKWRLDEAERTTRTVRPDLLEGT